MNPDTAMEDRLPKIPSADEYVSEETAAKRIDPAITPDSSTWKTQHAKFRTLLRSRGKTIQQILLENFTQHEARIFSPADRHDLVALQQRNTERYNALLSGRFKDVEKTLASKMTMLWFGLPVEPILLPLDEIVKEIEPREPEGQRWDVDPPLHFLTAHNHRNWGKDALKGREAINYPLPIAPQEDPSLTLRGGAAPDEPSLSLRGGLAPEAEMSRTIPGLGKIQDYFAKPHPKEFLQPVYLYGFQGCIPFTPGNWQTYATAVRNLLSVPKFTDERGRYRFTLAKYDRKNSTCSLTLDMLPLTDNSASVKYLQHHFAEEPDGDHENCCALFVMFHGETLPPHWMPQSEQFNVDVGKISLADAAGGLPRIAYLPFPKTDSKTKTIFYIQDFAANQYNPTLRVAADVLVGKSENSCNPSLFSLSGRTSANVTWNQSHMVYGALGESEQVWNRLHPLNGRGIQWTLKQKKLEPNQLALIVPNYFPKEMDKIIISTLNPHGEERDDTDYEALVRSVIEDAIGSEVEDKLDHVLLFPGSAVLNYDSSNDPTGEDIPKGYRIPIRAEDSNPQAVGLREVLEQFILDEQEPFVFLHPVWKHHLPVLYAGWQGEGSSKRVRTPMPSLGTSLEMMQDVIGLMCIEAKSDTPYRPGFRYITFTAASKPEGAPLTDFPKYVIGPKTTNAEWFRIQLSLTAQEYVVNIVDQKDIDWDTKIPKSNVWGPRYFNEPIRPARPRKKVASVAFDQTAASEVGSKRNLPKTPVTENFKKRTAGFFEAVDIDSNDEDDDPESGTRTQPDPATLPHLRHLPIDKSDREQTWATQPSIFDTPNPQIPITAPPAQRVFRTTSSVPMISKAIMTPTEQARLQKDFWDLRNIVLARVARCQYKDCNFTYRLDDKVTIERHIEYEHVATRCMWCEEPMYQWWSGEQKLKHLKTKHEEQLKAALSVDRSNTGKNVRKAATTSTAPSHDQLSKKLPPIWGRRGPESTFNAQHQETPAPAPAPATQAAPEVAPRVHQAHDHCPSVDDSLCDRCGQLVPADQRSPAQWSAGHDDVQPRVALPVLTLERKRCPFYEKCGALVGEMSEEQVIDHLRASHNQILGIPMDEDDAEEGEGEEEDDDEESDDHYSPPPPTETAKGKRLAKASPQQRKSPQTPKEPESVETIEESSSSDSEPADVPSPAARGRTRTPRKTIEVARKSGEDDDLYVDHGDQDDESDEEKSQESHPRRAPSPDWVKKLGPGDEDFEPDEDMYCSKCLRKAPKHRDRSPGRSPLGREKEMEYHTDPERCCRIRNGVGSAEKLPNRSGWIPMAELPRRVGQLKAKFLKKYPGYEQTLYPVLKSDHHSSLWRSDPNNDTNSDFWNIPWPPYEGLPPFPGDWEHPSIPSQPAKTKRKAPKLKAVNDPAYRYQSDEDSADGLQPDVDDLVDGKKKRKADEGVAKTGDGGEKGRVVKKARTVTEGTGSGSGAEGAKKKKGKGKK